MPGHLQDSAFKGMIGYRACGADAFVGVGIGANLSVHRADHDDTARCPTRNEMVAEFAGEKEPAGGIGKHAIEVGGFYIREVAGVGGVAVVYEDVDLSGGIGGGAKSFPGRLLVELVKYNSVMGVSFFRREGRRSGGAGFFVPAGNYDVGSGFGEGIGHRFSQPAGGPGNQSNAAGEVEKFVDGRFVHMRLLRNVHPLSRFPRLQDCKGRPKRANSVGEGAGRSGVVGEGVEKGVRLEDIVVVAFVFVGFFFRPIASIFAGGQEALSVQGPTGGSVAAIDGDRELVHGLVLIGQEIAHDVSMPSEEVEGVFDHDSGQNAVFGIGYDPGSRADEPFDEVQGVRKHVLDESSAEHGVRIIDLAIRGTVEGEMLAGVNLHLDRLSVISGLNDGTELLEHGQGSIHVSDCDTNIVLADGGDELVDAFHRQAERLLDKKMDSSFGERLSSGDMIGGGGGNQGGIESLIFQSNFERGIILGSVLLCDFLSAFLDGFAKGEVAAAGSLKASKVPLAD